MAESTSPVNPQRVETRPWADTGARHILALEAASEALASSLDVEESSPRIMEAVCGALGWPVAATWIADDSAEVVRLCAFWCAPGHAASALEAASRELTMERGRGFIGRVWEAGDAIWVPDIAVEPTFLRRDAALHDGLRAAVGIPIALENQVLGVMEFFCRETVQPDINVLRLLGIVGVQLGQQVGRLRAQRGEEAERRRTLRLGAAERHAVEAIAQGRPLQEVLDLLARVIEELAPGMFASILLSDGSTLRHGAAPSLPDDYSRAIDGTSVGPEAGSCGTAAYFAQTVVASDIATDPRWRPWRDLALSYGLRACWSTPILSANAEVLGTFALYYSQARLPDPEHLTLIESAAHSARIAIERHRYDAERAALIEDLTRAVRFSEMFVGVLGHDLRNPLSAILTASQLLQQGRLEPERSQRLANHIHNSGARMNRMIAQLLDFTRIRLGQGVPIRPAAMDLAEVCTSAIEEIRARAGAQEVVLEHLGDTTGYWDPDRLLQLISNLLGNALEHGSPAAPVRVKLDGGRPETIALRVCNAGEIETQLLPGLFDPFKRAQMRKRPRGLGIGLFISRQVAEAHGGHIDVTSGGGETCFEVVLPRTQTPPSEPAAVSFATERERAGKRTVILVEDDPDIRELLAEVFTGEGYAVSATADGAAALRLVEQAERPCAVVLDLGLPDGDGGEVYRSMRARPDLAAIPVVVTTADPSKAPSGLLLMKKPVDLKLLLETVRNLF